MKGKQSRRVSLNRLSALGVWVVATLLVTGGFATAAKWIDGKRIKPGSIASKQIRDKSVARKDLARGAVGTSQLADRSITARKLANGVTVTGPRGPEGKSGATGATGPTGTAGTNGLSTAQVFGSEPNFLVGTGGGTVIANEQLNLVAGGLVINGMIELYAPQDTPNTVSCPVSATFRDASDQQVGSMVEIASPAGSIVADGQRTTLAVTGALDMSNPPTAATGARLTVVCIASDTNFTEVSEIRVSAIAVDSL